MLLVIETDVKEPLRGQKEAEAYSRIIEHFIKQSQSLLPGLEVA